MNRQRNFFANKNMAPTLAQGRSLRDKSHIEEMQYFRVTFGQSLLRLSLRVLKWRWRGETAWYWPLNSGNQNHVDNNRLKTGVFSSPVSKLVTLLAMIKVESRSESTKQTEQQPFKGNYSFDLWNFSISQHTVGLNNIGSMNRVTYIR